MAQDTTVKLTWRGRQVAEDVRRASLAGINKTLGACVTTAKATVHVDTSVLQGSIMNKPAEPLGADGASGRWGSFDVNYALWQEVLPESRGGKAYLRPAADQHYGTLGANIRVSLA